MKISRNFQQFCKLRLTLIICREIYQQFINSSYWGNWGDVHGERKIIITSNIFDKFDKFDRICNLAKIRFDVVLYPEHSSWNDIFQQSLRHGMVRAQWNRREPDDANVKRSEKSIRKSVTRKETKKNVQKDENTIQICPYWVRSCNAAQSSVEYSRSEEAWLQPP